ncbi:unnamed protein product [Nippostrongylus brasiliensis]|uniref:Breast cancer type 1 susceptibility protein homolog n=1 Tax=Nippostrongylus brasiliensis TaxID=27835 RepID=A0A0N4YSS8_NIPBR|nr:unnamed protein product [Nippostrongylus brasiliensis]
MQLVRQRNMELSTSMESGKENETSILSRSSDKTGNSLVDAGTTKNETALQDSPLKNKTNSNNADTAAETNKTTTSKMRSRFSELAAEHDRFEVDQNWQQPGSKPKEAPSVLCTPAGMAQLKSAYVAKSPSSRETSPVKAVTITCNKTPQQMEPVREEARRIHFANPISATQVVEYESSMCTTLNTIDESSIVAGCGIHETIHSLPVPAARTFQRNKDGEVDMSSDEYGAHTFQKKDSGDTVDMSSDEYGAHTFLKKCNFVRLCFFSSLWLQVRNGSQTQFSPVQFNPVKTSSPNCETRTITMHTQMTTEIPVTDSDLRSSSCRKDFVNELEQQAKMATGSGSVSSSAPKSPSWKKYPCRDLLKVGPGQ